MPKGSEVLSRLNRTMQSILRIGNINVKDESGAVQFRDEDDTAFVDAESNRVQVHGDNAVEAVILDAPAGLASSPVFTLPSADGASGEAVVTDGSGNLSFAPVLTGTDIWRSASEDFDQTDDGTPVAIVTPPAGAIVQSVVVRVDSGSGGGPRPRIVVGTSAVPNEYAKNFESNLRFSNTYEIADWKDAIGSPDSIEFLVTALGQTFSGKVIVTYFVPS